MNDHNDETPAREYYTAQEICDLALEWGASATVLNDGGEVIIDLEREGTAGPIRLELGPAAEFYDDLICRSWLFVPSSPHRFCDRWNRFPYFAALSVTYDDNDIPMMNEFGFVVRAATILDFKTFRKRNDIFLEVMMFWFAMELLQEGISRGADDIAVMRERFRDGSFVTWWFGTQRSSSDGDAPDDSPEE